MHRALRLPLFVLACAILRAVPAHAQTITRVTPEIGAPGDLISISGSFLGGTGSVRFVAHIGGFGSIWIITVPPVLVTPNLVIGVVPLFGNFAPPGGPNGSLPIGTVDVGSPTSSNSLSFFYLEQTAGAIDTPGLGTTLGGLNANARPVIGFQIAGGPPVSGNALFTLTLENAAPTGIATLALGAPPVPPLVPYLDGYIGLNLLQPWQLLVTQSFLIDPFGDVASNIPIFGGGPLNVTVALVWVVVDPFTGGVGVSDGLKVTL
jgi:hypothetical protein